MKLFVPICLFAIGCGATSLGPVDVRTGEDTCGQCRMTLVSIKTAAQIVAPGEEPVVFDELGCLRDYLSGHAMPDGARIYVADHRNGAWVDAWSATFTRASITTPMSSGLIAHANPASRDDDPDARGGTSVPAAAVVRQKQVTP